MVWLQGQKVFPPLQQGPTIVPRPNAHPQVPHGNTSRREPEGAACGLQWFLPGSATITLQSPWGQADKLCGEKFAISLQEVLTLGISLFSLHSFL